MEIQEVITIIGMLLTVGLSGFALYKAFKTAPKEIKTVDAELSQKYSNLANSAFERARQAELRADEVEKVAEAYEKKLKELEDDVENHEVEIKKLNGKITEQEIELALLRKKVIAQDIEIIELKKKVEYKNEQSGNSTSGKSTS